MSNRTCKSCGRGYKHCVCIVKTDGFNLSPAAAKTCAQDLMDISPPTLYHPLLAARLKSVTAALVVAQALYWLQKTGRRGHFWKSIDQWCKELQIGRAAIREGLRTAKESGVLRVKLYQGKSAHYSVNPSRLKALMTEEAAPCIAPAENQTGQYNAPTHTETEPDPSAKQTPPVRKPDGSPTETGRVNTETPRDSSHRTQRDAGGDASCSKQSKRIEELKRLIPIAKEVNTPESLRSAARYQEELSRLEKVG